VPLVCLPHPAYPPPSPSPAVVLPFSFPQRKVLLKSCKLMLGAQNGAFASAKAVAHCGWDECRHFKPSWSALVRVLANRWVGQGSWRGLCACQDAVEPPQLDEFGFDLRNSKFRIRIASCDSYGAPDIWDGGSRTSTLVAFVRRFSDPSTFRPENDANATARAMFDLFPSSAEYKMRLENVFERGNTTRTRKVTPNFVVPVAMIISEMPTFAPLYLDGFRRNRTNRGHCDIANATKMPKTSFKAIQRRPKSSQWPETCLPGGHDAVSAPPKRNCELSQLLRAQMKDGFALPIDRRCRWSPFGSPNSFSIGRNASKHPSKGDHFRLVLFPKNHPK